MKAELQYVMKLCLALVVCGSMCLPAFGQVRRHANARVTSNLDAVARRPESHAIRGGAPKLRPEVGRPLRTRSSGSAALLPRASGVSLPAAATSPVSFSGFPALLDNFSAIPPDTTGAVGPQHVMTMLNTQVTIQSRTGVTRTNYPISLDAFWSPLGTFTDVFDPRVLYDPAGDRWIVSSAANADTSMSALLFGVSATGDPGGNWNLFRIDVGGSTWGDFPVLGFNGTWVAVSLNLFRVGGNNRYEGTSLYVFGKDQLYRSGSDAFTIFSDNQGELVPARDFDNRADTMYFVQAFTSRGTGVIRISRLSGTAGSEIFRGGNAGQVTFSDPWDAEGSDDADFAPQPDTAVKIDTGDDRVQNCVMRQGSIWCAQTVFVPYQAPTRSAVQWFQFDPSRAALIQRGRIEDLAGANFYAYPSIAVNRNSDVLLGFTRFRANEYPAAEFAFRTAQDPPGAFQPNVAFKRGEAAYVSPGARSGDNRWGDYSATLVDPVDDLSFWTVQEYASTPPQGRGGRFGTMWAKVSAPSVGPACDYALSASTQQVTGTASNGSVAVATLGGCPWMAVSNAPWITIVSGTPGTGSGTVSFAVAQNPNSTPRTSDASIAGKTFTITQAAPPVSVDLTVTAVNAPSTARAGERAVVTASVANFSSAAAEAFQIGIYLGAGPSVTAADTLLASCAVSGLPGGSTFTCSQGVIIPASIQPGRYAIGAIADDRSQIADPNRANNTRTSDFGLVTISNPATGPVFPAQGVVSAASYAGGGVAAGEIVTIFGSNLGPATAGFPAVSAAGVVDRIAGGTRVLFDGVAAPMVYATAVQVSAVVPFAVAGRAATAVQVEYLGVRSDPVSVAVARAKPAIFTLDKTGGGPGAILNQDYRVNRSAVPAAAGSVIQIYATGGGLFQSGAVEGTLAQPPYMELALPVAVRIGGLSAPVLYAGVAPGIIVGALQVNVVVPDGVSPGDAVPVELTVGGIASQSGVTVAIR